MFLMHRVLSLGGESCFFADSRRKADRNACSAKLRRVAPRFVMLLASILCVTSLAAEPSAPSGDATQSNDTRLRYRWKKDEPYAYRFRIEMTVGDDRVVTTDGSITYTARPASEVLPEEESEGTGTAFVVSGDGYLVSCAHVVEGATRIEVTLADKQYPARVVDWNKQRDLALLRIEANGLPELRLGATKDVELAQEVRAVGYPLTDVLGQSVKITRGTIAGFVDRKSGRLFQVDAAINPGNSGGPLVDQRGAVVGVNSAKLSGTSVSNVGFSVPVDDVRQLLDRNNVKYSSAGSTAKLDGPALARRVTPAVALVSVTVGPGGYGVEEKYVLAFKGQMFNTIRAKDEEARKWQVEPPPGARLISDEGALLIDAVGEVHDIRAEVQLPFLMGSLGQIAFEPLGTSKLPRWEHEIATTVTLPKATERSATVENPFEDPSSGDESDHVLMRAIERYEYEVGKTGGQTIELTRRYELQTEKSRAADPEVHLAGSGTVTLDRATGLPRDRKLTFAFTHRADGRPRATHIRAFLSPMDPGELKQALAAVGPRIPPRPSPPKVPRPHGTAGEPPSQDEIDAALQQLGAADGFQVRAALGVLSRANPQEPNEKVTRLIEGLLSSSDGFTRNSAAEALKTWRTQKSLPVLIAALDDESFVVRHTAIQILGTLPDAKAAEAIVRVYEKNKIKAYHGLVAMGSVAEPAVHRLAQHPTWGFRGDACKILGEIGTAKSLSLLQKLATGDENGLVRHAAQQAMGSIRFRLNAN